MRDVPNFIGEFMYNFSDEDYQEKKPRTVPISIVERKRQTQEERYQQFLERRQQARRAKIESLGYDYDSLTGSQQNRLLRGESL